MNGPHAQNCLAAARRLEMRAANVENIGVVVKRNAASTTFVGIGGDAFRWRVTTGRAHIQRAASDLEWIASWMRHLASGAGSSLGQ